MTSVPPPGFPARPELPEGIAPPPGPPPRMIDDGRKLAPWPWWVSLPPVGLLLALVTAALALAPEEAGRAGEGGGPQDSAVTVLVLTFVQAAVFLLIAAVLSWVTIQRVRAADFGFRRTSLRAAAAWVFGTLFVFYAFSIVWSLALGIKEADDLAQDLGADRSTVDAIMVGVLVMVIAPLWEEAFFRGFLFGSLWRATGWIPAAIISGAVFGFIHAGGTSAQFLVPLAVFGFFLAALYRYTGSLVPSIAVHAINNGIALSVTLHWPIGQALLVIVAGTAVTVWLAVSMAKAPRLARNPA